MAIIDMSKNCRHPNIDIYAEKKADGHVDYTGECQQCHQEVDVTLWLVERVKVIYDRLVSMKELD